MKPLSSVSLRTALDKVQLPNKMKEDLFSILQRLPSVKFNDFNTISRVIDARMEGYKNLALLSGKTMPPSVLGQVDQLKVSIRAEMHETTSEGSSRSSHSAKQVTRWQEQEAKKDVHRQKQMQIDGRVSVGDERRVGGRVHKRPRKGSFEGDESPRGNRVQTRKKQGGWTKYTKANIQGKNKGAQTEQNDPLGIANEGVIPPRGKGGRGRRGKQNNERHQKQAKSEGTVQDQEDKQGQNRQQKQNPGQPHLRVNAPLLVQGSMHLDQNTLMDINAPTHIGGRMHIHGPWHRRSLKHRQEILYRAQSVVKQQKSGEGR